MGDDDEQEPKPLLPPSQAPPVPSPQRLEVDGQANLPAPVHFRRLAVQLRDLDLRRRGRVRGRDVKLQARGAVQATILQSRSPGRPASERVPRAGVLGAHVLACSTPAPPPPLPDQRADLKVKLILDEVVDVPALARPVRALFVRGLDREPVHVTALVDLNVLYQGLQLLGVGGWLQRKAIPCEVASGPSMQGTPQTTGRLARPFQADCRWQLRAPLSAWAAMPPCPLVLL